MKKITTTLLMLILFSTITSAQNSFDNLWLEVEKFEVDDLPKSALKIVEEIYAKAEIENNSPQIIKSLFYKSKFALTLEEDAQLKIINSFKKQIANSNFPTSNVLQNILANLYWQYYNQNRYKFYNRTKTNNKTNIDDFRTWDLDTLFKEINDYFNVSLGDEKALQKIEIEAFSDILQIQKTTKEYTPTLFDFLAQNALNFYKTSENSITRPTYKFTIDNPDFLNDANTFKNLKIASKDSLSLQLNALKIYQKLLAFHIKTNNKNALANIDIERLNFIKQHAIFKNKSDLVLQTFKNAQEQIANHKASGLFAFEIAKIHKNNAKNIQALEICENIINKFNDSFGAEKCILLKKQIEAKTLSIQSEKYIPINTNSRILVTYKNIEKLFFTSYKINEKQQETFNKTYRIEDRKAILKKLEKHKNWQHQLRNKGDYLAHSSEIIVPKLENGMYLIVASENENLDEKSIYGTSIIQVTNLTLIENTFNEKYNYQVVDRNTGTPIENAVLDLNNKQRIRGQYFYKKLITDKNGFASFKSKSYSNNVNISVKTKNDAAIFGSYYFRNQSAKDNIETDDEITIKPFIFTDRSIYRPGQIVYFKVIAIKKQADESSVLKNEYVTISLTDVNNQIVKELNLKLNEFGSVAGQFILPNNGLTGEFEIEVDESSKSKSKFYDRENVYFEDSYKEISVEEYKRPKFETDFKPVTESYKINDSVTVNGFAKAFSGANITDAKVVYRVHRKVQYPSWYYWRNPNSYSSSQEITNGESITDHLGNFSIQFKALPDENVSKESLPIFSYEITADVTDVNGESRSATSIIKVGYHSLIASFSVDGKIDKNQKETILKIDTKNLNNEFVKAKGTLKIYKLQAPKNPLRKRPWAAPDYQDISENTFKTLFPNDSYLKDETDAKNWQKGKQVFAADFNTENSKEIILNNTKSWVSGKYLIILESKDKFGQDVKDEKIITLFSSTENKVSDNQLFTISNIKANYTINDIVELQLGSASKNMTVVVQIEKNHKIIDTKFIQLNNNVKTIQIPINKEDIGGFAIKYHFVNYNYFKSGNLLINVPYPPKNNIGITTNIFRDKLQPGQEETWSFTIKDDKNDAIAAEVLASMYDASLDEFKTHHWSFNPTPNKPKYYSYSSSSAYKSFGNSNFYIKNNQRNYYNFPSIKNTTYNWFGFSFRKNRWVNQQYLNKIALKFQEEKEKSTYNKSGEFTGTIKGRVSDKKGHLLAGVNILIKGTKNITISNFDGEYSITAKKDDVLIFSYLGYQSIEIKTENSSTLNVSLAKNLEDLDEVVVVGYGTTKNKSVTGAVSVISTDDIEAETISEEVTALNGFTSGDSISKNGDNITLRGANSLDKNKAPLYIVDGVIVENPDLSANDISQINILKDASATALYGSRAANGVVIINTKEGQAKLDKELSNIKARKNFKETAFFYPQLKTDKNGKVSFSFTMPEVLTRWKLQLLAHTTDVKYASKTMQTITQKELMVVPNAPRFLREKDTITFSAKITNLTNNQLSGFAKLILTDGISGKVINTELQNKNANKNFIVDKDGNTNVSWHLAIPENIQTVQYKIVAKAGDFSDGEQNVLPVLTNRMLVTETLPMWVRSNQTKTFTLDKLKNNTSSTLKNHKFTLEITSNPVWYAIQSLPYLMEYPYECAEQTFSRYYANTLASFVANSNPKIQEVFNAWKSSDALLSNLEKNQELKSLIIQETPWLRDAQSETEQKKRIALLFDLNKMKNEQEKAIRKLEDIQMNSGGFPWFKGATYESNFITQHIATGFGHLQKLGITDFNSSTENMIKNAVHFLDDEIVEQYKKLLNKAEEAKQKAKTKKKGEKAYQEYLSNNNLNYFTIQYLYMRSFYADFSMDDNLKTAFNYYQKQTIIYWKDYNLYAKGQIALTLFRNDEKTIANKILKSLKENAIISDELGMYWKNNTAGYYFYQAPVETHSLLIETFSEIENDEKTIDNLKIWLLKNKQTNRWKTTKATTEAVYALLLNSSNWISTTELVDIKIGNRKIDPTKLDDVKVEAGTGYYKTSWNGSEITPEMATVTISKKNNGIAWGGLYWQYFEDLDKITSAETPLKLKKKLFLKVNSDTGKELKEITDKTHLKVGDLITVRIELSSDRNMEFIHLKDMRASAVEPINVFSKYKWQDNLGYYESTKDAATNFFFDRLPKGVYVFEYDVRVNNAGNFSNGISTIQSMYAPEFSSHSEGIRLKIEN
ncbi:carboxypeptidase-like regulatory domain-containing protein [Polaribacter vadi]|uniref:alpha-2-macroglobulin family protein n=1 Tax=Polaribacter TaxID=52959 RepID=UPI001C09FA49|nr:MULTISPECIES: MG2 domain-containing protein [Polaribacter]MBU3009854.1 carboxypeptidase-like regulatory domain-containing protein [Polaribacter vadi]MDO6739660.1 MG2 domain-containing protein [Polaribacter sp. 1_MG-2023]